MKWGIIGLAIAMSVAASTALAEPPEAAQIHDLRTLFERLDSDHDGQVTLNELPDRLPDHIKELIKRSDTNGDEKISREELAAAVIRSRPGQPGASPRGPRPPAEGTRGARPDQKTREPQRPPAARGSRGPSRPAKPSPRETTAGRPTPERRQSPVTRSRDGSRPPASRTDPRRSATPQRGPSRQMQQGPQMAVFFALIDKNEDGKLSLEEFADGMRRASAARGRQGQPGMGPAGPRGPMTPPMGKAGPGRPPMGHPGMGYFGMGHFGMPGPPMQHHGGPCPACGKPGFGQPPMGPGAAPWQSPRGPGAGAKKIAEARGNAMPDRHAAAAKMRAEFAKRAAEMKKMQRPADPTAVRDALIKANREATEKRIKAMVAEKRAQAKKAQATKAKEKK